MNKRIVSIISFMLTIMMTVNAIAAVPVSGENGQNTLYSAVSNSYGADAGDDLAAEQAAVFSLQTATTVMKDIGHTVAAFFTKSVKKPAQVKKLTLKNPAKGKLRIRYQKVTGAKGYGIKDRTGCEKDEDGYYRAATG